MAALAVPAAAQATLTWLPPQALSNATGRGCHASPQHAATRC